MSYTLGIDIGTFETKGVLVDHQGVVRAQAARGHKMIVPEPGWAEHRAEEDWWGDFVTVCQTLLKDSGIDLPMLRRSPAARLVHACCLSIRKVSH